MGLMDDAARLEALRREIDEIDRSLIALLRRRFGVVAEIGRLKEALRLEIEDWTREKRILENCKRSAGGELADDFVEELMRLILAHSKRRQSRKAVDEGAGGAEVLEGKVAVLGPKGTFSEEAALKFGARELVLSHDIEGIFDEVLKGSVACGMVPVENSLEGSVAMTLELLLRKDVKICGEVVLNISHHLLALPGTRLEDIKEVVSHPHAVGQCKAFLRRLGVRTRDTSSTAEAAKEVADGGLASTGAIAPRLAAELYGLEVLEENVQDEGPNKTRFLVIAPRDHEKTSRDKTSLILGLRDRPGALHDALGVFADEGINLTRIESRPSRKALGEYLFYLDLEGHRQDPRVRSALKSLEGKAAFLKVLGSYPRGG